MTHGMVSLGEERSDVVGEVLDQLWYLGTKERKKERKKERETRIRTREQYAQYIPPHDAPHTAQ